MLTKLLENPQTVFSKQLFRLPQVCPKEVWLPQETKATPPKAHPKPTATPGACSLTLNSTLTTTSSTRSWETPFPTSAVTMATRPGISRRAGPRSTRSSCRWRTSWRAWRSVWKWPASVRRTSTRWSRKSGCSTSRCRKDGKRGRESLFPRRGIRC